METTKRIRCPKCDSTLCYLRIRTKMIICRSCGNISKLKEEENEKDNASAEELRNKEIEDTSERVSKFKDTSADETEGNNSPLLITNKTEEKKND